MIGRWLRSPELQGLAALAAVATAVVAGLGWLNRKRRRSRRIEAIRFAGRTRRTFLERVWAQRIAKGLQASLQRRAEMHLNLRNTPELVKLSFDQSTARPGELLSIGD